MNYSWKLVWPSRLLTSLSVTERCHQGGTWGVSWWNLPGRGFARGLSSGSCITWCFAERFSPCWSGITCWRLSSSSVSITDWWLSSWLVGRPSTALLISRYVRRLFQRRRYWSTIKTIRLLNTSSTKFINAKLALQLYIQFDINHWGRERYCF